MKTSKFNRADLERSVEQYVDEPKYIFSFVVKEMKDKFDSMFSF